MDTNSIINAEGGWDITSSSSSEIYFIHEVIQTCNNCPLICTDCKSCMHRYSYSCTDSAIQWNMCKHVHLLCKFRQYPENYHKLHTIEESNEGNFYFFYSFD